MFVRQNESMKEGIEFLTKSFKLIIYLLMSFVIICYWNNNVLFTSLHFIIYSNRVALYFNKISYLSMAE